MLRTCSTWLRSNRTLWDRQRAKVLKRHAHDSAPIPKAQFKQARQNLVSRTQGEELKRESYTNRTYAMQFSGDSQELAKEANFGITPLDVLTHGPNVAEVKAPPPAFTPLMARKMAEGRLWPAAPEPETNHLVKDVKSLRHFDNLFASEKKTALAIEYWIRRNLRSAPAHIVENIDLTQLIIERIIPDRRKKMLYFVWTTVQPEARFKMEPHVTKLTQWIIRTVKERLMKHKRVPFLPSYIVYVYKHQDLPDELPKALVNEMKTFHAALSTTLEERLERLRAMDKVESRMAGVPWFMPYLWSKDEKVRNTRQAMADFDELEKRKKELQEAATKAPTFKV